MRRCPKCLISPLPEDYAYFWGEKEEDWGQIYCKKCRVQIEKLQQWIREQASILDAELDDEFDGGEPMYSIMPKTKVARVVIVPKFKGLPHEMIRDWHLPRALRDKIRRVHDAPVYITDGERLWHAQGFHYNSHFHLDWDGFLKLYPEWLWLDEEVEKPKGITLFEYVHKGRQEAEEQKKQSEKVSLVKETPEDPGTYLLGAVN